MLKSFFRDRTLLFLLVIAALIRLFSLREDWVERYYTFGLYPFLSKAFRTLLGWVPFSIGDLLYIGAFVWLVVKVWKLVNLLKKWKAKEHLSWLLFRKYLKLGLIVYIVFSLLWGLNYFRQGIENQLGLE